MWSAGYSLHFGLSIGKVNGEHEPHFGLSIGKVNGEHEPLCEEIKHARA